MNKLIFLSLFLVLPLTVQSETAELSMAIVLKGETALKEKNKKLISDYFSKTLGRKIKLHDVANYSEVIEAIKTGKAQIGRSGPAAYAKLWLSEKGKVKPIAGELDKHGNFGYHAVLVVRANSRYTTLGMLGGSRLALTDKNSTS